MDQYLTTYRKDYTWPASPRYGRRASYPPDKSIQRTGVCTCPKNLGKVSIAKIHPTAADKAAGAFGPICRLLDVKTYPAKTAAPRENEATKYNQPEAYMKKLQDKYPNICQVHQTASVEQLAARVDEDRMKSTYQLDFCHEDSRLVEGRTCTDTKRQSDIDSQFCLQSTAPTHLRNHDSRSRKSQSESKKAAKPGGVEFGDGQETRILPWKSEYQDNVSKTGQAIMKYRIHHAVKQVEPVWAVSA